MGLIKLAFWGGVGYMSYRSVTRVLALCPAVSVPPKSLLAQNVEKSKQKQYVDAYRITLPVRGEAAFGGCLVQDE